MAVPSSKCDVCDDAQCGCGDGPMLCDKSSDSGNDSGSVRYNDTTSIIIINNCNSSCCDSDSCGGAMRGAHDGTSVATPAVSRTVLDVQEVPVLEDSDSFMSLESQCAFFWGW